MSEQFVGEIRLFGFPFPPRSWALCQGQTLPISQNQALFSLLGTFYGGDGRTTFGLPDLRGRAPVGANPAGSNPGGMGGAESVTLTQAQLPPHNHLVKATTNTAAGNLPSGNLLAVSNFYGAGSGLTPLAGGTLGDQGGSQPVPTIQPSLVLNFCIALQGLYPSRG